MVNGSTLWVMYQGFMHLDTETRAAELHWSFLFLVNLAPLCFASDTCILSSDDRFWGNQWISMGSGLAVGFRGCAPLWDEGLRTRLWILQVSLVEIVEPFQESSNWWCSRLLHSVVLSRAFPLLHSSKEALHQVSLEGSLHYFTWFFASYASILSSNDRFWEFNGQWVFEDLLLHEMKAFLPDFGCCKNHLLISLKLARNPPIDVQCFCTVSCSLVCFICSEGQKSLFSKWAPMVVCTRLLVFLLQTLASRPPMMNGQWVFESVLLYEMKAFSPDCWTPQSHVPNTKYPCVSWHCACVSDAQVAA